MYRAAFFSDFCDFSNFLAGTVAATPHVYDRESLMYRQKCSLELQTAVDELPL
jgi:hypothetical protein